MRVLHFLSLLLSPFFVSTQAITGRGVVGALLGLLVSVGTPLTDSLRPRRPIPGNLTEANRQLDYVFTPQVKAKFSRLCPGELLAVRHLYILDDWGIGEWGVERSREDSPLVRYLNTFVNNKQESWDYQGWQARRYLVLLSYLRHLQRQPFDVAFETRQLDRQGDSVAVVELNRRQQDQRADSLAGVFIPRNLTESVAALDQLLADSVQQRIRYLRTRDELEELAPSLGEWLSSYWGLYTGSRLELHLQQLGYETPGSMAEVIVRAYSDHLSGKVLSDSAYQTHQRDSAMHAPPPPPPPPEDPATARPGDDGSVSYRRFWRTGRITDFEVIPDNKL